VTISVDGVPASFVATAQVDENGSVCPACMIAQPLFALRSFIAWQASDPRRVVQVSSASNADPIRAYITPSFTSFTGASASLVFFDGKGGGKDDVAQGGGTNPAGIGRALELAEHLVGDDDHCYRCLADNVIPWGAPGANEQGFHIEQCGYAAWTAPEWKQHLGTLKRAAFKTAYHCHKFGIPVTFVTAAGLRAGKHGITTHAEVSKAWPNDSGNHHDPGTGWPRTSFMTWVRLYYKQLGPAV